MNRVSLHCIVIVTSCESVMEQQAWSDEYACMLWFEIWMILTCFLDEEMNLTKKGFGAQQRRCELHHNHH